jgi:small-conductance mechanosensitive channel
MSGIESLIHAYVPPEVQSIFNTLNIVSIAGNSLTRILGAGLLTWVGYYAIPAIWLRIVASIEQAVKHTPITFDDLLVEQLKKINPRVFLLLALLLGLSTLVLPAGWYSLAAGAVFAVLAIQFAAILAPLVEPLIRSVPLLNKPDMKPITTRLIVFGKTALWAIAGMTSLSSLGMNISPLLGSLGVLGLGGALAFQQMIPGAVKALGFHFSKPFKVGDKIAAGNHAGFVEEIDITTTKLKKGDGSFVDVPNEELMTALVIPPDGPHFIEDTLKLLVKIANTPDAFAALESTVKGAFSGIADTTFTSLRFADFKGDSVAVDVTYSVLAEKKAAARHEVVAKSLAALTAKGIVFSGQ